MVIHHQRKMPAGDWVDTIGGTLGLAGAADGMVGIFREREALEATMRVTGRDVEDSQHGLRWHPLTASWSLVNRVKVGLGPVASTIRDLVERSGPLAPAEIAKRLERHPSTVRTHLQRMVDLEQLVRLEDGRYGVDAVDDVTPVDDVDGVDGAKPKDPRCPTCASLVRLAQGRTDDGYCDTCHKYVTPVQAPYVADE